jgi:hypothetical protein
MSWRESPALDRVSRRLSMIPKSGSRFSEKIMLQQKLDNDRVPLNAIIV